MSSPPLAPTPEVGSNNSPSIMETTLGLEAIKLTNLVSEHPEDGDAQYELRAELSTIRTQLGNTDRGADRQVIPYLESYASQFEDAPRGEELLQAFARSPQEGGVQDSTLMSFLEWHVQNVTEQQSNPAFGEVIETVTRRYGQVISQGVESGDLNPTAARIIPRLYNTRVQVGDMWQMQKPGDEGYHDPGTNQAVILEGEGSTFVERERDLVARATKITGHELTHLEFGNHISSRIEREAGVEDLAASVKDGEFPPVLDPDVRAEPGGYYWERKIMHAIDTKGSKSIPARMSRRALTSPGSDSPDVRQLAEERDSSWAVTDVVGTVTRFAADLERRLSVHHATATIKEIRTTALQQVERSLTENPKEIFGREYRTPVAA